MPAYIVVTGGVMSGIGKGALSASIGRILKSCGYRVTLVKIDPYVNIDAGTLSPFEHGEVFVLDDGGEVDLDFGHYERFLGESLTRDHNITTGKIYSQVIAHERKGDYLGKTVQIIPHVTNEIKASLRKLGRNRDFVIVEIGGTVGDIEGQPFIEAIRQLKREENLINVHLTFIPLLGTDQKTKPTQHSVIALRKMGLLPDIIVGRCKEPLRKGTKRKIALFCDVEENAVISDSDVASVYELPLALVRERIHEVVQKKLNLKVRQPDLHSWEGFVSRLKNPKGSVRVAIVGKYGKGDTYLSIKEAIVHAGAKLGIRPEILWIDSEKIEQGEQMPEFDAMITPGGFGSRGTEGKIEAIRFARENRIPWLGLCYGFQLAVVEFARNVAGLKGANSTEIDPGTPHRVIIPHWEARQDVLGGTMRLGAKRILLEEGSAIAGVYGKTEIFERHRHRYGLNPEYRELLESHGMRFPGFSPEDETIETLEIPGQFFIGVQYQPEFLSRPLDPQPLFVSLLENASKV